MQPTPIIQKNPDLVLAETAKVGDDRNKDLFHPLLEERPAQMMLVDNVVSVLTAQNYGYHMASEKLSCFLVAFRAAFPPAAPLAFYFAHANGDLRRSKLSN